MDSNLRYGSSYRNAVCIKKCDTFKVIIFKANTQAQIFETSRTYLLSNLHQHFLKLSK